MKITDRKFIMYKKKWINYWCNAVITPTSQKEIKKFVGLQRFCEYQKKVIKELLTFIKCIPTKMRGPMSDALSTLFEIYFFRFTIGWTEKIGNTTVLHCFQNFS